MTQESDPQAAERVGKSGIEEQEKYTLSSSRTVVPLLKALIKKPDLITAKISGTSHSIMTAMLDVLPGKNLIILDYGPVEALNTKMLEADRIIFTCRHEMVETRFTCNQVQRVKYRGAPAFAAAIPTSVLYLQRRGYFRIKPLISHPVFLTLNREEEPSVKFKVVDIGIKGLALVDTENQLKTDTGDRLEKGKLTLPANPSLNVDLEVRYQIEAGSREAQTCNRIGARFTNLTQKEEFILQRFINMVQIEQNSLAK